MRHTEIDNHTAEELLIGAHDGDVALLYLFYRHTGSRDLEEAARSLCRTMQELSAAREKLQRMGLWDDDAVKPAAAPAQGHPEAAGSDLRFYPPADDDTPQMTAEDVSRLAKSDPAFESVRAEATRIKGRELSSSELRTLAVVYDQLGLPPEVVLMLLHYCLEQAEERRAGSRPSFRNIQQEAYHWANLELMTIEQADAYIRGQRDRSGALGRIQRLLGLDGRALTAPEKKNIGDWLDMGFPDDVIQLAYERTVVNTGRLKWPYMSEILRRWHAAGMHDRKTIEEKDRRRSSAVPVSGESGGASASDQLAQLQNLLNNMGQE